MYLTQFWFGFILVAMVGLVCNLWILDERTSTWSQIAFDLVAYIFILGACFGLEKVATHTSFSVSDFARSLYSGYAVVFLILYGLSFRYENVLGFPLRYYGYFAPFAENIHQISMTLVPLPFIGLQVAKQCKRWTLKCIYLAAIPFIILMAVQTGSTKAWMAVFTGAIAWLYSTALIKCERRIVPFVHATFALGIAAYMALVDWSNVASALFEEADSHDERAYLYSHALILIGESPLVGRGPGSHIEIGWLFKDAHETFLTVALQSGAIGLLLFVMLVARVFRESFRIPALFAAFTSLMVYAAGGDILRRLPAWVSIFVVLYWSRELAASTRLSWRSVRVHKNATPHSSNFFGEKL
jgi:O-antigen ligase